MTTPFTYYLYHKPTGKKYYGVRFKNGCHPNDLWNKYFSSSVKVKKLIEEYGLNSFDYQIRKIFKNKKDAINWETKFLKKINAINNNDWLNQNNGYGTFGMLGKKHSKETLQKMSKSQSGKNNPMYGKKHSEEIKKIISEASASKKNSEETRKKISESKKGKPFSGYNSNTPESIAKRAKSNTGKKRSEESKQKMRKARLNYLNKKKNFND